MNPSRGALATVVAIVGAVLSCATQERQVPLRPRADAIAVRSTPVALNAGDPSQQRAGRFVYAGGVALDASPVRFGGLSDLKVSTDNRVLMVSDEGRILEGRLTLDATGRLTGLTDVSVTPLAGLDGRPLTDKAWADSEGVAVLPGGDRLVSFERQHRIWRYPKDGGTPVPAPAPAVASTFPLNAGLEALAALPGASNQYLAGSEGGSVWRCSLAAACRDTVLGARVPPGFGLTALAVSPDGRLVALLARAFEPERGVRAVVRLLPLEAIESPDVAPLDELVFDEPLTRDNFEGLALMDGADAGVVRLYLLSDNNFSSSQHSYLLAFDWRPEKWGRE